MFEVRGEVSFGKKRQTFTLLVEAKSKNHAKEKAFSLFGSRNGVRRRRILLREVIEVGSTRTPKKDGGRA